MKNQNIENILYYKKWKPTNFTYTANFQVLTKVPKCDYLGVTYTEIQFNSLFTLYNAFTPVVKK